MRATHSRAPTIGRGSRGGGCPAAVRRGSRGATRAHWASVRNTGGAAGVLTGAAGPRAGGAAGAERSRETPALGAARRGPVWVSPTYMFTVSRRYLSQVCHAVPHRRRPAPALQPRDAPPVPALGTLLLYRQVNLLRDDQLGSAPAPVGRPVRTCWVADDEDEASYAGAPPAGVPPLDVSWHRRVPALEDLAGYDLLVVDPGALRDAPDALERRVHADLPSLPIVFFSGLAQRHHLRAGPGLAWALPALVHWIAHGGSRPR